REINGADFFVLPSPAAAASREKHGPRVPILFHRRTADLASVFVPWPALNYCVIMYDKQLHTVKAIMVIEWHKPEAIDMRKKSAANEVPYTESVPELGRRLLGLGRQSSYAAARRGEIPTVRIGGKLRGLSRVLEARLARDPQNNA